MQKYGVNELRKMFLEFFEGKGHLAMKSFSLVPHNDKSLLLINSGMAPLKPYFTGAEVPPRRRVTTCRTGLCTFSTSYTHCFFYHSITSMVNFGRCQRTSIFTYSAGNTSFFIDTCHSFCQCFVPLSNFVSLLYLKKVNPSVTLLHKNLP